MNLAKRNPVAVRAAIVAAATAVLHVAVVFGLLDNAHAAALVDAVGPLVDLVGLVVLVAWARAGVTPNAKVITRVTTKGTVVTGDASTIPTGTELNTADANVAPVPVDPALLD